MFATHGHMPADRPLKHTCQWHSDHDQRIAWTDSERFGRRGGGEVGVGVDNDKTRLTQKSSRTLSVPSPYSAGWLTRLAYKTGRLAFKAGRLAYKADTVPSPYSACTPAGDIEGSNSASARPALCG
mmetsp:Transcript_4877/g.8473  ORF Transcript_4877/g.8473 Transcript_4877/m.8473 type:complete len:126 (-) Transcript_4877:156-533(-)